MDMGVIVITCYRPKDGKEAELKKLMETHLEILQGQGLVTDRKSIVAQAADGTILEVFEWRSKEHIDQAHSNPEVQKMWADYAEVCDYVKLSDLQEVGDLFPEFRPLN